jgi:hypothetical protein
MSRLKNFTRHPATGCLQPEINAGSSLVSIPLILHWLPKAEFSVGALLVRINAGDYHYGCGHSGFSAAGRHDNHLKMNRLVFETDHAERTCGSDSSFFRERRTGAGISGG